MGNDFPWDSTCISYSLSSRKRVLVVGDLEEADI